MKAMILAAGRGMRLRPLTDHTPKPLLPVGEKPLIEYTLESLVRAGYSDIIINLAYLGGKIQSALGDGGRFNARIHYSHEGEAALETGGGIIHALPLLGSEPFLVVNGDIATDFPHQDLVLAPDKWACLVLVPNPPHHCNGDFALNRNIVSADGDIRYTFSGIGVYRPELFASCKPGRQPLAPILCEAMTRDKVSGQLYDGFWMDIGSYDRLCLLDKKWSEENRSIGLL